MNLSQFYDSIWAFKHAETGQMCADLDEDELDSLMIETYVELCDLMRCDPRKPNPHIDLKMQDHGWIQQAKNLGVIIKRSRKEAIEWNKKQQRIEEDLEMQFDYVYHNDPYNENRVQNFKSIEESHILKLSKETLKT